MWAATLFVMACSFAHAGPDTETIQVIVNASTRIDTISRSDLRAIFSMRARQFPDGEPVTVFVLPDQDERHRLFCKQILHLLPYVLRDTWDQQVFTGTGRAPITVGSQQEMINRVAHTTGGIGYIVGNGGITNGNVKTLGVE